MANGKDIDNHETTIGGRFDLEEQIQLLSSERQDSAQKARALIQLLDEGFAQSDFSQTESEDEGIFSIGPEAYGAKHDEVAGRAVIGCVYYGETGGPEILDGTGAAGDGSLTWAQLTDLRTAKGVATQSIPIQPSESPDSECDIAVNFSESAAAISATEGHKYGIGQGIPAPYTMDLLPERYHQSSPKRLPKFPGVLSRARNYALRASRRLVRYLKSRSVDPGSRNQSNSPRGKNEIPVPERAMDLPTDQDISWQPQPQYRFADLPSLAPPNRGSDTNLDPKMPPLQLGKTLAAAVTPRSDFEILLRTKIFRPAVELIATIPEPSWMVAVNDDDKTDSIRSLFTQPPGIPLTPHSLQPLGKFVAEREKNIREVLKETEVGLGVSALGLGVDLSTKSIFTLLKPYQWINTWRSLPREVHVGEHLLPDGTTSPTAADVEATGGSSNSAAAGRAVEMRLHQIENELTSSVKYQFGESEYITVITYSEGRVDSGAVCLFRASFGENSTVIRLDLEARFQDMPREICRILAKEGDPNRLELKRNGKAITFRAKGKIPPPRPAVVVAAAAEDRSGKEPEKEWVNVGSGWRTALHIVMEENGQEGDGCNCANMPREGLIATIPQMLALLHLRYRLMDCVPSTPVLRFESPLRCETQAGGSTPRGVSRFVRRGLKLLGPPSGAAHVGAVGTIAVLFSRESHWVKEQLFWA